MGRKPSRVEVKDMIGEADADGNGTIEFSEFAALMEKWVVILWSPLSSFSSFIPFRISPTLSEEELKEAFAVYDRDGNGQISAAELKQVRTSLVNILTSTNVNSLVQSLPIRDGPKYQICIFLHCTKSLWHLVEYFRSLWGHLLGHYEFCNFFSLGYLRQDSQKCLDLDDDWWCQLFQNYSKVIHFPQTWNL